MTHSDGRQLPIGICRSFNATKLNKGKDGIVKNDNQNLRKVYYILNHFR